MKNLFLVSIVLFPVATILPAQQVQPPEVEWELTLNGEYVSSLLDLGNSHLVCTIGFGGDLAKIDKKGNVIEWNPPVSSVISIIEAHDNGFILIQKEGGARGFSLVKIDLGGNVIWQKGFWTENGFFLCFDIQRTFDLCYALTGYIQPSGNNPASSILLLKVDMNGNEVWSKKYAFTLINYGNKLITTSDLGFAIVGTTYVSAVAAGNRILLLIDKFGNLLWSKNQNISGIRQTISGNFRIVGSKLIQNISYVNLMEVDTNGKELWSKTYGYGFAGDLQITNDNGCVIAGVTNDGGNFEEFYIIKTDGNGNEQWALKHGGKGLQGSTYIANDEDGYLVGGYTKDVQTPWDSSAYVIKLGSKIVPPSPTPLHFFNTAKSPPVWEQLQPPHKEFNTENPTLLIMHGWNIYCNTSLNDPDGDQKGWLNRMADELHARLGGKVNLLAWDWLNKAKNTDGSCLIPNPNLLPFSEIPNQAKLTARALKKVFGSAPAKYAQPIHLVGHSLGAYVISLVGTELMQDYRDIENDTYIPSQVTLFDPADIALGGVWLDSAVETLRINNVYVDLYAGDMSKGDHKVNLWTNVPNLLQGPAAIHSVYNWYIPTIPQGNMPLLYTDKNFTPFPPDLKCTVGFDTSPLGLTYRPRDDCPQLGTLLFAVPIIWEDNWFLNCGRWCRPNPNHTPTPQELSSGVFGGNCDCISVNPWEIIMGVLGGIGDGGANAETDLELKATFTLPNITIKNNWDYLSFEYIFTEATSPSMLELFIIEKSTGEKKSLWKISSEATFGLDWQNSGLMDLQEYHNNEIVDFEIALSSSAPGAKVNVKNLIFWTDQNHDKKPPVANAGPDRAILAEDGTTTNVLLDASATENPDGDELLYWWTLEKSVPSDPSLNYGRLLAKDKTANIDLPLGGHKIKLIVRDGYDHLHGHISQSELLVEIEYPFVRGDSDGNGKREITDAIATLTSLFLNPAIPLCVDAADTDDSNAVDVSDAIALLNFLFLGGPNPKPPYPTAGLDPTPDFLGCNLKPK